MRGKRKDGESMKNMKKKAIKYVWHTPQYAIAYPLTVPLPYKDTYDVP